MDVEIPVGVGRGQVAVVDLLAGELQRAVTARGPIRSGSLGQRGPAAFERHRVDRVAQVHPRLLVGEDDAAIATDRFVGAGLLGMPVRVDQRVDAAVAGRVPDGRKQGIGIGRKAAIDHQCAVLAGHRDHVAPGTLEQRHAAQIGGRDSWRDLLRAGGIGAACKRAAERCGAGTAERGRAGTAESRRRDRPMLTVHSRSRACRSAHELATHPAARCPPRRPGVGPGPATRGFDPSAWSRPARGEAPPPPCTPESAAP